MKAVTIALALLALAATGAVVWQQRTLSMLSPTGNPGFTNAVASDGSPARHGLEDELAALREQTKELAKLRNEVGRLRSVRAELAAARAEATRLAAAQQQPATVVPLPPGFVARGQLANAGFATPENAIQTFFWALANGEFETIMQSMSPNHRDRKEFDRLPAEQRAVLASEMKRRGPDKMMEHFNDFGVRSREDVSADVAVLHLGSSLVTNTISVKLQRFDGEWRLLNLPR
jgi:hypothetical protein